MKDILCLSNHIINYYKYKDQYITGNELMTLPILLFMNYYVETNGQYLFDNETFINNTFGVRSKTLDREYCGSYNVPIFFKYTSVNIDLGIKLTNSEENYFSRIDKALLNRILSDSSITVRYPGKPPNAYSGRIATRVRSFSRTLPEF